MILILVGIVIGVAIDRIWPVPVSAAITKVKGWFDSIPPAPPSV